MTAFDPQRHHRRSIRLKDYDYAQAGAYFVTICTHQRQLFFENPAILRAAKECWLAIPVHAPVVELDEWVVMPNHTHGIMVIDPHGRGVQLNAPTTNAPTTDAPRDPASPYSVMSPQRNTLSVVVRTYKAAVTTACRQMGRDDFAWQRNYYEHIIRNERELNAIRQYIQNNPLKWALDRDNPTNWKGKGDRGGRGSKGVQLNALTDAHTDADTVEMYLREAGL
jgi:putative transposase